MQSARQTIILVEDNLTNLSAGKNILRTFYSVIPVTSAAELFDTLEEVIPDLILLDIEMPEMDGYEAIKKLKSDEHYADIPVIFLTALDDSANEIEGFDLGAADYITKPFSAPMLLKRIEKELLFERQKKEWYKMRAELQDTLENLENKVSEKIGTVTRLHNAVFDTVVDMVEFRDSYTGGHIIRTQLYVQALIEEILRTGVYADEVADWDMHSLLTAAKLHDVGKIAVSDAILSKNAKLEQDEFETMKSHVNAGVDAIDRILRKTGEDDFYNHALRMAGTHHEKWDGSGYPIGLKGYNIPLEGRLMAIADVYDALISKRQYKEPMSHEQACGIIEAGAGTHFDPTLVDVFRNIKGQFKQILLANSH